MPDFQKFVSRHGESAMQALIERLERYEGIRATMQVLPLEERWAAVMRTEASQPQMAA